MFYRNWEIADFRYLSGAPPLKYLSPTLYKNIFAIKITCPNARATWKFGGWVNIFGLGSNFPGAEGLVVQQIKLNLNSPLLVQPPTDFDYYRIEIDFPRWFFAAEVIVWQTNYESSIEKESANQLAEVAVNLENIKIDLSKMINPFNR